MYVSVYVVLSHSIIFRAQTSSLKQNLLSNSARIMNLLNLLIAYVLLHLLASNLGIEFHSQIASNGPKNVENNSYVKDESTFFRLSTNHTSSIDIATTTIYIIQEICKLRLIPFGIRSQSCFLILPASESLINHA